MSNKIEENCVNGFLAKLKAVAGAFKWTDDIKGLRAWVPGSDEPHGLCPITAVYFAKEGEYIKASDVFNDGIDTMLGVESISAYLCEAADGTGGSSDGMQYLATRLRAAVRTKEEKKCTR